jgi:uncharacterized membrane protein
MTTRKLSIFLAISVALNLFAVAAGVTVWAAVKRHDARIAEAPPNGGRGPLRELVQDLDPATRDRVKASLRASALAARPDFEAGRAARRRAVELASAATLDPAAVQAALEESRAAEMRGRARLEADAVALLQTVSPADRVVLGRILQRRGATKGEGEKAGEKRDGGRR